MVGLVIGDGNLSNSNGRAVRLRITCDDKYPLLKVRIVEALKQLLPKNKVSEYKRKANCTYVYCYSNSLEEILGWKAKGVTNLSKKLIYRKNRPYASSSLSFGTRNKLNGFLEARRWDALSENLFFWGKGFFALPRLTSRPQEGSGEECGRVSDSPILFCANINSYTGLCLHIDDKHNS